ncbi:MAG: S49 family peptidase [Saprospiraceae bacterium]|nr:S49 family peptidase [Saprospiraceae bacterium]MBK9723361.1 S49 family peptidase [Saprospiraceae bacterium]
MSETSIEFNTHFEKAFSLLYGKEFCIDPVLGMGYFNRFVYAIETNSKAFEPSDNTEFILNDGSKIVETGNLSTMKDERLTSLQKGTIVKLFLNDYMAVNDGLCTMGIQSLANNLLSYKDNPNISGAILEVNSGGGEAMAGQIMFNAIKDFKKPVVAYVHNAGSAAFMAIAGVKEIVASGAMSRVGSIGAFISLDKKFITQYKERFIEIYSDLSGDKNAGIRSFLETGDSGLLKDSLNETVIAFQNLVLENRPIKKADETLRGGMFQANDGKKRGLIDIIGSEELAIKRLKTYIK